MASPDYSDFSAGDTFNNPTISPLAPFLIKILIAIIAIYITSSILCLVINIAIAPFSIAFGLILFIYKLLILWPFRLGRYMVSFKLVQWSLVALFFYIIILTHVNDAI